MTHAYEHLSAATNVRTICEKSDLIVVSDRSIPTQTRYTQTTGSDVSLISHASLDNPFISHLIDSVSSDNRTVRL